MFRRVNDVRTQLEITNYFSSLDGYLTSLQSINPSMEQNLLLKSKDRFLMGIPPLRASVEVKEKKIFSIIFFNFSKIF
jgi:hypothetical protein